FVDAGGFFCFLAEDSRVLRPRLVFEIPVLLRANPSKDGDAEPRSYRGRRPPCSPGRQHFLRFLARSAGEIITASRGRLYAWIAVNFLLSVRCRIRRLGFRILPTACQGVDRGSGRRASMA